MTSDLVASILQLLRLNNNNDLTPSPKVLRTKRGRQESQTLFFIGLRERQSFLTEESKHILRITRWIQNRTCTRMVQRCSLDMRKTLLNFCNSAGEHLTLRERAQQCYRVCDPPHVISDWFAYQTALQSVYNRRTIHFPQCLGVIDGNFCPFVQKLHRLPNRGQDSVQASRVLLD